MTPLNDLGTGTYNGDQGGLYSNGTDVRPAGMEASAESLASQIQPLDANGNPDPVNGKIVFVTIGMSNTKIESAAFLKLAGADNSLNSRLVLVNAAQGGQDAAAWLNPNGTPWQTLLKDLKAAGVTAAQVQVVWVEQALKHPGNLGGFPADTQDLQTDLETIARDIHVNLPHVKLAYFSSMTHTFTTSQGELQPEPEAYETGFAVKWMIQDQLTGKNNLNWDPTKGAIVAPLISWGPYLWASTTPRSDGLTWTTADTGPDGTHPSSTGAALVADMLLAFFKTDPTATPWFLNQAGVGQVTNNQGPTVTLSANVVSGTSPLTVRFTATATESGGSIVQYAWTFDDGDFSLSQNPTKTFYAPGTYLVHLAVTDANGYVTLESISITVNGARGATSGGAAVRSGSPSGNTTADALLFQPALGTSLAGLPAPGAGSQQSASGQSTALTQGPWLVNTHSTGSNAATLLSHHQAKPTASMDEWLLAGQPA
jgi:PKD repeat protein